MARIIPPKGIYGSYKCSACQNAVRSDSRYCWYCGEKFDRLYDTPLEEF